jgi:hypothetical protein
MEHEGMPDPTIAPDQAQQRDTSNTIPEVAAAESSGRGQVFSDIQRRLSPEDLTSPGVLKLVLEMLAAAERDCADYKTYVSRYHEAHERAAVLAIKLQSDRLNETIFTVGIAAGGAGVGLSTSYGPLCLIAGLVFIIGFSLARIFYVRKT